MAQLSNICKEGTPLASLRFCQGTKVLPGLFQYVYGVFKRDIVKWPTLPEESAESTMEKLATYVGDFTLAGDKKWVRIDLATNKGNVECETQGDRPSRTFLNKLTASYPGSSAAAAGFCRMAIDEDMVFLVRQRDGKFRVLGSEAFPIDVKPKFSTGEGISTSGGTDFEIEATDICPAPYYEGVIATADDGDIDAKTGLPKPVEEP